MPGAGTTAPREGIYLDMFWCWVKLPSIVMTRRNHAQIKMVAGDVFLAHPTPDRCSLGRFGAGSYHSLSFHDLSSTEGNAMAENRSFIREIKKLGQARATGATRLIALVLAVSLSIPVIAEAQSALKKVRLALPTKTVSFLAFYVAYRKGFSKTRASSWSRSSCNHRSRARRC